MAASAGETHLFESAPSPIVPEGWKLAVGGGLAQGVDLATAAELTTRCQGIPALAGPCMSLTGDVADRRGDKTAAAAAFEEAARVRLTPALSERIRKQTTPASNVTPEAVANPRSTAATGVILNRDAVVVVPH